MAKMILVFLILFVIFFFGFKAMWSMSGKEALALTKLVAYSIICAMLVILTLSLFVLLF